MLKYFQVATVTIKIVFHRFMFALITQDILVKKLSLFFILNFCKFLKYVIKLYLSTSYFRLDFYRFLSLVRI